MSASKSPYKRVAILGPGLLGGSLALAIRRYLPKVKVAIWGRRDGPLALARELDAAHTTTKDVAVAVKDADLIILCTPVGIMGELIKKVIPAVKAGAVVTDVGSVKGFVHKTVGKPCHKAGITFIGSHPMAGSDKQGIQNAEAELFQFSTNIISNSEGASADAVNSLINFWTAIGCLCTQMSAKDHDYAVAHISHMPHALAALVVNASVTPKNCKKFGFLTGSGFRDATRIAMGDAGMWAEIMTTNSAAMLTVLDECTHQMADLRAIIAYNDTAALKAWLLQAHILRTAALDHREPASSLAEDYEYGEPFGNDS